MNAPSISRLTVLFLALLLSITPLNPAFANEDDYILDSQSLTPGSVESAWWQDFFQNTDGLTALPSNFQHADQRLNIAMTNSANIAWVSGERRYGLDYNLFIGGELTIAAWNNAGGIKLGARNSALTHTYMAYFKDGQIYAAWKDATQWHYELLGPAKLNTAYSVEMQISATESVLSVYESDDFFAENALSHSVQQLNWGDIELAIATYAGGLTGWVTQLYEEVGTYIGEGTVFDLDYALFTDGAFGLQSWDQDFSIDSEGLTPLPGHITHQNERLELSITPTLEPAWVSGVQSYRANEFAAFEAYTTITQWNGDGELKLGATDNDLTYAHMALFKNGQIYAAWREAGQWYSQLLGPANLNATYRVGVEFSTGQSRLVVDDFSNFETDTSYTHNIDVANRGDLKIAVATQGGSVNGTIDNLDITTFSSVQISDYIIPAGATFESLAQAFYGSAALADQLQAIFIAESYSLSEGEAINVYDLPGELILLPVNADTDGDGVTDEQDAFPSDPTESADLDGDGIGDNADTDRDGDGVENTLDTLPNDPTETMDLDGDGIGDNADTDRDGDGVANTADAFPNNPAESRDTDGDGQGDNSDNDRDGDGVANALDAFPDNNTESSDLDGDGIGDNTDTDRDGDGVANDQDYFPDDAQAFSVPTVTIASPQSLITVGASPLTINGTVSDPNASLTVNGVPVNHSNGVYSTDVALSEGSNTIIVRAVDQQNHQGTATISVALDKTPPTITIDSPQNGATLYEPSVAITGLVNDIVRGTVSENDAELSVTGPSNTVIARVANRSYLAESVALEQGANQLILTATDAAGNIATKTLNLTYAPPETKVIRVNEGQGQRAAINTALVEPLSVKLTDNGSPIVGQAVVFRVIQGDGYLQSGSSGEPGQSVVVATDNNGIASANYQLGSRSGIGNQQVRATSAGFPGEVKFHASADASPGSVIAVIDGNNQRGAVRQPLPRPFVVAVSDKGSNLIPNAPVTFVVTEGSGRFSNGGATISTLTDSDGRASAQLTLGPEQGLDRQRVEARLVNTEAKSGFSVSALMPGEPGQTSISGVVLDNQDQPMPGVSVRIENSTRQATTNSAGQFVITQAPIGSVHLLVEGSTTTRQGDWPSLSYNIVTVPGVDNPLASPVYLVELDTANAVLAGQEDKIITLAGIPGFALNVKAGSVTFPNGEKSGNLSITQVNANKIPMPPPNGLQPQLIVTIQPHGAKFDPPAPLTMPNTDAYAPLSEVEMYSYDHDLEEFVTIGLGIVSADGQSITSKPGSGVIKAGWHSNASPSGSASAASKSLSPLKENQVPKSCESYSGGATLSQQSRGCPRWSVSKTTLNVRVADTPLWFDTPIGPDVNIALTYNTKSLAHNDNIPSDPIAKALIENTEIFGNRWTFGYTSGLFRVNDQRALLYPDGRVESFTRNNGAWQPVRANIYDELTEITPQHYRLTKLSGESMDYTFEVNGDRWLMSTYTDINGESLLFTYNADGTLATIADALGRITTLAYATVGTRQVNGQTLPILRVSTITDPFGRTAQFNYDASLNLTGITDMGGYTSSLTYDANLNITSIARPQFGTWQFRVEEPGGADYGNDTYPAPGAVMGENERVTLIDPNGNSTEYYYDAFNDRTWLVSPKFYRAYETSELSNKGQPKTIYQFKRSSQGWRRIASITDEQGNVDNSTFHGNGQLRSKQAQNGSSNFYEYNEDDQLTAKTIAKGTEVVRRYEYQYLNTTTQLVSESTGPSVASGKRTQTQLAYDDQQNLTSVTRHGFSAEGQPLVRQQQFSYNSRSQLVAVDGTRTDVDDSIILSYYDCADITSPNCSRLQRITNALGHELNITQYTASGLVSQQVDQNGFVSETTYDGLERVIQIVQYDQAQPANQRITSINYRGAKQHISSVNYPNGLIVNYTYDDEQRLIQVHDNLGNRVNYRYDQNDQRIAEDTFGTDTNQSGGTEALQATVELTYNQIDLITAVNQAGSISQYQPDGYGNIDAATDPNANPAEQNQYDPLYRLTRVQDALGYTTQYDYNINDQLSRVRTHNNIVTTYQYNDFGDRTQESSPDRGVIDYQYDSASNITHLTDARGITRQYNYDALNRVTQVSYPNSNENITYRYDSCANGIGRLCEVIDATGTTRLTYDVYGNILTHTKVELGDTYTTTYSYDSVDQVVSMRYPNGITLNYTRDHLSRITAIALDHSSLANTEQILSNIRYRADHQVLSQTLGNGLTETRDYDLQGRLISQQLGALFSKAYGYDANGNILDIAAGQAAPQNGNYEYDALNRLTQEGGDQSNAWSYDPIGNRLTLAANGETDNYNYMASSSRLLSVSTGSNDTAITLDASGNTLSQGLREYTYNDRGQLASANQAATALASYEYNFANQRTQKSQQGTSHLYHHDLQGRRIQHDMGGQNHSATVFLGWQPVAHIDFDASGGSIVAITYLTGDQLGTPRVGTSQSQSVVWRWSSDGFGNILPEEDIDGDGQRVEIENRFAGQYFDEETGLHYNWHRYYDPATGRYTQSDPIGLDGGINTYGYVGGNPTGYIDPDGLIGRRASVTSPLQSLTNVNANLLIRSIQRIDPAFTFPVVTPVRPGQPINYSPSSVRQLQQFLRNAQTAGFCGPGASQMPNFLNNGQVSMRNLQNNIVPPGTPNTWTPTQALPSGFKYQWQSNGTRFRLWGHGANPNAPAGSFSQTNPTTTLRVNNRYITTTGQTVGNPNTPTNAPLVHLPLIP